MSRWLLLVVVLAGCESDRERDCKIVRDILEPPKAGMPRRYYTYDPKAKAPPPDSPFDRLRKTHWKDPEVAKAVKALVESTGWTMYTPYSTQDGEATTPSLAKLCGFTQTIVE